MSEYKDHEFFEQVDDSPRQQKLDGAFWHYTSEDGEAWKRHLEEKKDAKQVKEDK